MFRKSIAILLVTIIAFFQPLSAFSKINTGEVENTTQPEGDPPQSNPEAEDHYQASIFNGQVDPERPSPTHTIHLKSRQFKPAAIDSASLSNLAGSGKPRVHVLVQLDFIPRELAKAELETLGLKLLAYVPDYAWIASVPATEAGAVHQLPGVAWVGELRIEDKLDPSIRTDSWGPHNLAPDGKTAAIYVILHKDEDLETGRNLVASYGGIVKSVAYGINLLIVEIPKGNIQALASEDAVQWIEPAAIPFGPANDGIRAQIGVNTVNGAPYNLDGSGVDVLIYDSGQVGDHVDFGTRLTHADGASVRYHSTHVAGTVGGSGLNSLNQGGSNLQWRGMAPGVDLISYGAGMTSGVFFYEDAGDIEADFAQAQNTYGADIANGSLSSNIYYNPWGPDECDMMGRYGVASVLLDQIVRGGNSAVGMGDKYITVWAAGNERNQIGSCGDFYNTTSPPASAKNPIQVGASNTNNNTMTDFSSWGPTEDGRIKPVVVAGGCQTTGDGGITSTDNDPVDEYLTICGTSMATPAVTGGIALMLEHYRDVYSTSGAFWPSTAKAILMHTAVEEPDGSPGGNPGPDYQWGFGQVDIHAAVDLITAQAFYQDSVAEGELDAYYLPVTTSINPLTFSLAWDDFEATLNANPTLINDLDLEVVSPSGVIVRPWVLNPASPVSAATRGVDSVNNQEQVRVDSPEVGTWLIRVRGTTVPQGPQDYSLICEGCQSLSLGVCQNILGAGAAATAAQFDPTKVGEISSQDHEPQVVNQQPTLTEGEHWQQTLEAEVTTDKADTDADLSALEAPKKSYPEGIGAFLSNLDTHSLDLGLVEILGSLDQGIGNGPQAEIGTDEAAAVMRVGINGACAYPNIQSAVNAASHGDTLRVSAGVYFENLDIYNTSLTIEGDYNSTCTSKGGGETRVEGSLGSGSTMDIQNNTVTLRDLVVAWGINLAGGGISAINSNVTLDNVDVTNNYALAGGGIYVNPNSVVNLVNGSDVRNNAVVGGGGGVGVEGQFSGTTINLVNNCAPDGGGIYALAGNVQLNEVGLVLNQAPGDTGKGGGIWADGGSTIETSNTTLIGGNTAVSGGGIYLEGGSTLNATDTLIGFPLLFLWPNLAETGAGIYADTSTVDFSGTIDLNIAEYSGAGVFATNSTVNLTDAAIGGNDQAYQGNQLGTAGHTGVGLFLTGGTQAVLDNTTVVSNTFQTSGFTYGGGIYVSGGSNLTLVNNSSVEEHLAPSAGDGRGAGIYINGSTVTLDNSQVISNTAGTNGGGIRMYAGSTLNVLNGSNISNNRSLNAEGGGIAATQSPVINIAAGTFHYNRSGTEGGAIYLDAGTLDVDGWYDFRWNLAEGSGGAVAVMGTADADFDTTTGTSYLAVNTALGDGGALYVDNSDTVSLYADSGYQLRMNSNNALGDGGAAYADGGAFFEVLGDVQATSNIAGSWGGVYYLSGGSTVWLMGTNSARPTLWVNQADSGGAIYALSSPRVECDGADFGGSVNGNRARDGEGGAIFLITSDFIADNCIFQNNQATSNGGAIAAYKSSSVTIDTDFAPLSALSGLNEATNSSLTAGGPPITVCDPATGECSSFRYNTADSDSNASGYGGAIFTEESSMNVSYTYLHHNSAVKGGAIYQAGDSSVGQVTNSLLHHNVATRADGAGIHPSDGTFTLNQVTLADNVGGMGFSGDPAATNQVHNSIAWGNSGGGFAGVFTGSICNIDQSGNVGIIADPLFVNPTSENYRLRSGSPAIDACARGLSPDLDAKIRPFGLAYDMGAFEYRIFEIFLPLVIR
jgi:predicted outer membrane repeat protein